MNPDRLFNYLDGKLPEHERNALEEELMYDAEARREFEVARRIHSATRGSRENLEVLDERVEEVPRGKTKAKQVLFAALVLVAMNVSLGLLYIAHHEAKNPNRALLEKQSRDQLQQALEKAAAAGALTPPPLGVEEMRVRAQPGHAGTVADEIGKLATRLGGTPTKGIPEDGRVKVLVEIAVKRVDEFRAALVNLGGLTDGSANFAIPSGGSEEKISLIVQVTEEK